MKLHLIKTASAAAISLSLLATPLFAQELGLKQLQDSAITGLSQLGIDPAMVDVLTLEELAQIQSITGGGDSNDNKVQRVETVLRDAEDRIATGGAVAPSGTVGDISADDLAADMVVKANVGSYLAQLGIADEVSVDALTTDQLLQVQLISESEASIDEQRMRVGEVIAN